MQLQLNIDLTFALDLVHASIYCSRISFNLRKFHFKNLAITIKKDITGNYQNHRKCKVNIICHHMSHFLERL